MKLLQMEKVKLILTYHSEHVQVLEELVVSLMTIQPLGCLPGPLYEKPQAFCIASLHTCVSCPTFLLFAPDHGIYYKYKLCWMCIGFTG